MSTAPASRARRALADHRVIAVVVAIQLAISLGYYAVMTHVVAHLHHDLGLLAGVVTVVLTVRVAVQNMLFLPAGVLTDTIGPARTGALACVLRAAAFALLGAAEGVGGLLVAVVVMAVGGALFHPAAQSVLAGTAPSHRSRGFSAYVIAGQVGAVAGPPLGLLLLAGGFGLLSAVTTGAWVAGAVLFLLLLHRPAPHPGGSTDRVRPNVRGFAAGVSAVFRDRGFLRFALIAAPSTLLTSQVTTVIPLKEADSGTTTLFFCAVALVTAAIQPWCGRRGDHPRLLRSGLLCAGAGYLVLLATPSDHRSRIAVLLAAAVLHGLAAGIMQSALFQAVARCAPSGRFGAYTGLLSFLSGAFSLAGGFVIAPLFNIGGWGMAAAMTVLGLLAVLSALALPAPEQRKASVLEATGRV
ncbi:MFS transporter [Actinocorallia libanotica]|uniref:Major facilitator superfamily (MFS) profile domain-containing protein n=1 Tax=Actinocorallia libanotica TaxID=46162 RepID=A0ABP4C6L5_9ACTN